MKFLLLYSPRWLFFYPGILLAILGVFASSILLFGPLTVGNLILDVNTLMYASLLIIMGVQSILFSVFTYVFGASTGLLPEDRFAEKVVGQLRLERGLLISLGMIILGFASSVGALLYWEENQFGRIDPSLSMRLVIPGAVLFTLGVQVFFASFFLGILKTRVKSAPTPTSSPAAVR